MTSSGDDATREERPGELAGLLDVRRSFGARLLLSFLGAVLLIPLVTFLAVRSETRRQVELVEGRAVRAAASQFERLETEQRRRLGEAAERMALGRRTKAAVEAAVESGDVGLLRQNLEYELQLSQLDLESLLLVLTDADGEPILASAGGRTLEGENPADVLSFLDRMYEEGTYEVAGYRVVGGRLYNAQSTYLELAGRPIGTFTLGTPLTDEDAENVVVGAELCFVVDGECVAGTELAKGRLASRLASIPGGPPARIELRGERWRAVAEPLDPDRPDEGWRVLAVPLGPVLAPFRRISRMLAVSGLVALAVAVGMSLLLTRSFTRPIRQLVGATARVAEGDFETRVDTDRSDELGVLGRAFDDMTRGLALKERYRGVLDKVVSREVAEELIGGDLALGGEIREVTVLFGDLRGFTALTEGMRPEEVVAMVNECMETLTRAVDAEGGVVDKYVGDEIMAIFGAPMEQPDAPDRAVRSALRMQRGIERLNERRRERGDAPLGVGIGIATGEVIAGNVGSSDRLNYTVLGRTVNLASRLCGAAGPGETLMSDTTRERVSGWIDGSPMGDGLSLKGFSEPVTVWRVQPPTEDAPGRSASGPAAGAGTVAAMVLALAGGFLGPAPGAAQSGEGGLPTLGLSWISPSGRYQADLSGRLDLEVFVPDDSPPWIIPSTDPFVAGRLRLFLDLYAGDDVYGLVEFRADRGEAPSDDDLQARVEQAYLRVRPFSGPVELQAGLFASPFGGYPLRHHTVADPLIRPPLPYDYRTILSETMGPSGGFDFLFWKNQPRSRFRNDGRPVIWGVPYQLGGMIMTNLGPFYLHAAFMNGAPSSDPDTWDNFGGFENGSVVAGASVQIVPELRLSGWFDTGPWMQRVEIIEPVATDPEDDPTFGFNAAPGGTLPESAYSQTLWGVEALFQRGPVSLRGEAFLDTWDVPNVPDDARDVSWYAEGQVDVTAGLFAALRYGEIRFRDIDDPTGGEARWDFDVTRWQFGLGYRIVRNLELRAEYMINETRAPGSAGDDLFSAQIWWEF